MHEWFVFSTNSRSQWWTFRLFTVKWPARSSLLKCLWESKDRVLTSFFVFCFLLLLFAKLPQKLSISFTSSPHFGRNIFGSWTWMKNARLFFQKYTSTCFLQINFPLHTHIVLLDISMTCFSFFCFNKLQRY